MRRGDPGTDPHRTAKDLPGPRPGAAADVRALSRIVEQAPFSIVITDLSTAVEYANPTFCELTGYSKEEVIGQNPRVLKSGLTPPDVYHEMWRALTAGAVWRGEFINRKKNGEIYRERAVIAPVVDSNGRATNYVALKEDVTGLKEAEEALRASEERYRSILDASPDAVAITDLDRRVLLVSPMALKVLRCGSKEDLRGRRISDFLVPEDRDRAAEDLARLLKGKLKKPAEYSGLRSDGSRFDVEVTAAFIRDAARRPTEMVVTLRDITSRKQTAEALAQSLREKEGLLRETHHRVKNNLALIVSLMRITAGRSVEAETKAVLKEMQTRVNSVVLLNETLYKTETYSRVRLAEYLGQVATHAFQALSAKSSAVRLILDLETVEVPTAQAIPCGLIVNELVTNSLKHAVRNRHDGEVRVELHSLAGGKATLRVSDTGCGLPSDFESRRGKSLGMQLVSDLARQIGGRLEVGAGPNAEFTVRFNTGTKR